MIIVALYAVTKVLEVQITDEFGGRHPLSSFIGVAGDLANEHTRQHSVPFWRELPTTAAAPWVLIFIIVLVLASTEPRRRR